MGRRCLYLQLHQAESYRTQAWESTLGKHRAEYGLDYQTHLALPFIRALCMVEARLRL